MACPWQSVRWPRCYYSTTELQTFVSGGAGALRNQDLNAPGLTRAGKEWLKYALDPFHDTPVHVEGLPDADTSPSVVQLVKKSLQISAPAGTTGNWSFHLFTQPEMYLTEMSSVQLRYGNFTQNCYDGAAFQTYTSAMTEMSNFDNTDTVGNSLLNLFMWNTDLAAGTSKFFPDGSGATTWTKPTSQAVLNAFPTSQYSNIISTNESIANASSRCRVLGFGFELHNTTADLYKQGTLTLSRSPNNVRMSTLPSIADVLADPILNVAGNRNVRSPPPTGNVMLVNSAPPASISEALSYPISKQWAAEKGAYCVGVLDVNQNRMEYGQFVRRGALHNETASAASAGVSANPQGYATIGDTWQNTAYFLTRATEAAQYSHPVPCEITSVIASGLSQQTTFTLELSVMVEVSPHLSDPLYGPLTYSATPSPMEDRAALELYQRIASQLPPGVPVSMNPAGEFFQMIRGLVAKAAPAVSAMLGAVPHPAAQLASKVADCVGRLARVEKTVEKTEKSQSSKPPETKAKQAASK